VTATRPDRRTGYAQVDGLSIAYQIYGDGPRHLIVVPGYMTNIEPSRSRKRAYPGHSPFSIALAR
jgi:hypothetical protein